MALSRFTDLIAGPLPEWVQGGRDRRISVDIPALRRLAYNIHVAWLFLWGEPGLDSERIGSSIGKDILIIICRALDGSRQGRIFKNWRDLGNSLGVLQEQLQAIENNLKTENGRVVLVLATYTQQNDATMGKVIRALEQMGRKDIITDIARCVRNLVEFVRSYSNLQDDQDVILRPRNNPRIPLPLELLSTEKNGVQPISHVVEVPRAIDPPRTDVVNNIRPNVRVAFKVMLTFADDGKEAAYRVAKLLRSYQPKIGVVILEEKISYFINYGHQFVDDCFNQVDAVIPILTKGYFEKAYGRGVEQPRPGRDQDYVKYIYNSLNEEYNHNGCRNDRVVAIKPEGLDYKLPILTPALGIWFGETSFGDRVELLLSKASYRR